MHEIRIHVGGDEYVLTQQEWCTEVQRVGSSPFVAPYEDCAEAHRFFERCVGAALLREKFPGYTTR